MVAELAFDQVLCHVPDFAMLEHLIQATRRQQMGQLGIAGSSSSKTYSPPPPPPADCSCSMYCNYCDSSHREQFSMTGYSCNSTYDSTNLQRCTDDLYTEDDVERSYETYMDYWCDLLYDSSKF